MFFIICKWLYPYNFKKFAKDNNVTYRDFFHSLKDASFWYKNVIFDLVPMENKKGREIVESEVLGAMKYLESIRKRVNIINVAPADLFGQSAGVIRTVLK